MSLPVTALNQPSTELPAKDRKEVRYKSTISSYLVFILFFNVFKLVTVCITFKKGIHTRT